MTRAKSTGQGAGHAKGKRAANFTPSPARRGIDRELIEAERLVSNGQGLLAGPLLEKALADAPGSAAVHRLISVRALIAGHLPEALQFAENAVQLSPLNGALHLLRGRTLKALGHLNLAIEAYRRCIAIEPRSAEAHVSLGIALKATGALEQAIESYRTALAIEPNLAAAHANLANALALQAIAASSIVEDANGLGESMLAFRRAVELDPSNALARRNLGAALYKSGERDEGIQHFRVALSVDPQDEEACAALVDSLRKAGRLEEARDCIRNWVASNPNDHAMVTNLSSVLLQLNELDEAIRWAGRALEIQPGVHQPLINLGSALQQKLDVPGAITHYRRAMVIAPEYDVAHRALLLCMNYVEEDPQAIVDEHRRFGQTTQSFPRSPVRRRPVQSPERLRIAYISGDFRRHSVAYFMEGMFAAHDRRRVELMAYHNSFHIDEVTARLKGHVDKWFDCLDLTDDLLTERIRRDNVDVLIDLSGHTQGGRLGVFARRPAPLQLTYLGYPTTTGLQDIDYRLTDSVIDPQGHEHYSVEQCLRFPNGMFCYRPDADPEVGEPPMFHNGFVTFGSFNNLAKIGSRTIDVWATVLKAVPGSKLFLKTKAFAQESVRCLVLERLSSVGIDASRVTLNAWRDDLRSHLEVYREIDIALDTFPFNGATTTCEALWMGVPTVTFKGGTHTGRMGASILTSAGCSSWVAEDREGLVHIAVDLAARPELLLQFRRNARAQLKASPLLNAAEHTSHLEDMLFETWRTHQSQPCAQGVHA